MVGNRAVSTGVLVAACLALVPWLARAGGPPRAGARSVNPPPGTVLGPAVKIGNGLAQVFVREGPEGRPSAFGVQFSAGMLEGLPAKPNPDRALDWHYFLAFPHGPATGFDHLMIDWHPTGHMPQGVYTVPHFDFHFYVVSEKEQLAIHYAHDESPDWTGIIFPRADLLAPGYFIPPAAQVSKMGLHAVWIGAPEMQCKPFMNTFIYGYYKGRLIFLEPMITTSYLKTRPRADMPIATPPAYSFPGWYPSRYEVSFDPQSQMYSIVLGDLKAWGMAKAAGRAKR